MLSLSTQTVMHTASHVRPYYPNDECDPKGYTMKGKVTLQGEARALKTARSKSEKTCQKLQDLQRWRLPTTLLLQRDWCAAWLQGQN